MKWKIKLQKRRIGGFDCPRPRVTLNVLSRYEDFAPVPFVVDTGADISAMPIQMAQNAGIPFERSERHHGRAGGLVGAVDRFRGVIRVRIAGAWFVWPCDFLDVAPRGEPYGVLGRAGFLRELAVCIGSKYLTIRHTWASFPWWQRWARLVLSPIAREQPFDRPL